MSCIALISAVPTPTIYRQHLQGDSPTAALAGYAVQRLPVDPLGSFELTLNNIAPGSAVQVQTIYGDPLFNGVSAGSALLIPLTAYTSGSPLNDLMVKVRKGSAAPYYQPWSTKVLAIVGSTTVFVSQNPDE